MRNKILLLGSGELGKELVISLQRLGQYIIAVDSYPNAPAMQVSHEFEVIDMLNGDELDRVVFKHSPDIIVPEIESIRTEKFYSYEEKKIKVIPSAKAVNFTMNRKSIRDLASKELNIKTADYSYASNLNEFKKNVHKIGFPCVVKPLMSSSGKGQSILRNTSEIELAWNHAISGSRGDLFEVIIEQFIDFEYEITLLTLTQNNGKTLFCSPIGHRQERGDYQESWQPMSMKSNHLKIAQEMAKKITSALGGSGIWGVEFFISKNGVYFSELSPRPHDTGMVTLARTQNFNQFELHARSILGIPVMKINQYNNGASAVVLSMTKNTKTPNISGLVDAASFDKSEVRIFGKPSSHKYRRMGVALTYGKENTSDLVIKAREIANKINVT